MASRRLSMLTGAVLVAAFALVALSVGWRISPLGDASLLREFTRLPLPRWPTDLYYYDNGEHYVVAHMRLSPKEIEQLPGGRAISQNEAEGVLQWFDGAKFAFLSPRLPGKSAKLRSFCHCERGRSSQAILDESQGELWVVLNYPDLSGDEPGCPCSAPIPARAPASTGSQRPPPVARPLASSEQRTYAEIDEESTCQRVAQVPVPESDAPNQAEATALRGCNSEALYYGIGVGVDYVRARQCAFMERRAKAGPTLGGPAILMMVYANGEGVERNIDLALRFSCEFGGAPAEIFDRASHLSELQASAAASARLDVCGFVTSGYLSGVCAGHLERPKKLERRAREQAALAGLPAPAVKELQRRANEYFQARSFNEVDQSGTLRAVFSIQERSELEDAHVEALERLRDPNFVPEARDNEALDLELSQLMARIGACKALAEPPPGGLQVPSRRKIRTTQARWLHYRRAFVALAASARSKEVADLWRAWLTQARVGQLTELASGC